MSNDAQKWLASMIIALGSAIFTTIATKGDGGLVIITAIIVYLLAGISFTLDSILKEIRNKG